MKRLLVTGSRHYSDVEIVRRWLHNAFEYLSVEEWEEISFNEVNVVLPSSERVVLVHGGARGLDSLAATLWSMHGGGSVEAHPADWEKHGKAAGPIRNQEMVNLGADLCLAFPLGESRGTRDCIYRALLAGIPTFVVTEDGSEARREYL